jgi:hypothetical protein
MVVTEGHGRTARAYTTPAGAPPSLDYNDDGTQEIIAGYEAPDAHQELVPFVIEWQDSAYHLISMTPAHEQDPASRLLGVPRRRVVPGHGGHGLPAGLRQSVRSPGPGQHAGRRSIRSRCASATAPSP